MQKEKLISYPDFPSLNLVFDITKERITNQLERANILDNKANFIIGSATALMSAMLVLLSIIPPPHTFAPTIHLVQYLLIIVFMITYILVMFTSFLAYRVKGYRGIANPEELYKHYLLNSEHSTKSEIFRNMVEAYKHNEKLIRSKGFWVTCALTILVGESMLASLVALFLFLQAFT